MTKFLLIVHVLAAIIAIGPVTVAASAFPAAVRRAVAEPGSEQALGAVRNLHRICRVYALVGVVVPVFGLATANSLHVLGDTWLIVSIVLTALAAAVLALLVLPGQSAVLEDLGGAFWIRPDQGAGSGACDRKAEEGADAERRRLTTTRRACVPGHASPARSERHPRGAGASARLAMATGVFNLLWATVTVLMIVRPGSTTGA
ncbi:protease [Streptomyces sp. NPDC002659]|uniref:protease n=1 Tax=Streptomyces sp. NPDC002659 TaxID=3364656 RepID=UPI00369C1F74